jgi:hypothetical protein
VPPNVSIMSTDSFDTPRMGDSTDPHARPFESGDDTTITTRRTHGSSEESRADWRRAGGSLIGGARSMVRSGSAGVYKGASDLGQAIGGRVRSPKGVGAAAESIHARASQLVHGCRDAMHGWVDGAWPANRGLRWRSIDVALVLVWSLAVGLIAVELALAVSPLLGVAVALLEGVVLGAGAARLIQRVMLAPNRPRGGDRSTSDRAFQS